jgi:hypothetical protein
VHRGCISFPLGCVKVLARLGRKLEHEPDRVVGQTGERDADSVPTGVFSRLKIPN